MVMKLYIKLYSKTCLKRPLKKKTKVVFQDRLWLNAGQKYCRMILSLRSIFVLSIFEWPLKTGFTVTLITVILSSPEFGPTAYIAKQKHTDMYFYLLIKEISNIYQLIAAFKWKLSIASTCHKQANSRHDCLTQVMENERLPVLFLFG